MGILTRVTRNITRRKARALLVVAALSLALTLLIILPPSINARQELTQQAINGLTGTAEVLESTVTLSATEIECGYPISADPSMGIGNETGSTTWLKLTLMNESLLSSITSIPNVIDVIQILRELSTADRPYGIYGIPLDNDSFMKDPTILPANITEGRNLQVGDSGVVVLDEKTAENFSVSVGENFTVSGRDLTVVGIEGLELPQSTHGATMSLSDAWYITNTTGQASSYKIFVDNVDNVNAVVARIRSLDPNLEVSAGLSQLNVAQPLQNQLDELNQAAQNTLSQTQTVGIVEIITAVIAASAVILFMMLYSVRERTREIGTLKAMGASDTNVLEQFMLEGVVLSLVAAVVAIVIGVFALPVLSSLLLPTPVQTGVSVGYYPNGTMYLSRITYGSTPFIGEGSNVISASMTPEIILLGLGAALLLGVLGSLYPALKAARTRPAEAMRYE